MPNPNKHGAVLAVDPGPEQSAAVLWNGKQAHIVGMFKNDDFMDVYNFKLPWHESIEVLLAVEMIESFGMPVGREVFQTCVWIGRFVERWGGEFALPGRRLVKVHLCGSAKAKDSNIRQALVDRFGKPGTKKKPGLTYGLAGDLWQAFALAVTVWDSLQP